ncbi:MAG: lipopolysaccharide biosynthesis protein RfbH [Janthinobacterium lividum]
MSDTTSAIDPEDRHSTAAIVDRAGVDSQSEADLLRATILELVGRYHQLAHQAPQFEPQHPKVPISGRVYGARDMQMLVDSALDFWLTTGRFNEAFEKRLAARLGAKKVLTVNSGSSANLVAFSSLTSPRLGARRLLPGDEVITCATGFPTTVNPILQSGLVPVFVDVDIPTYNINVAAVEAAISPRTRAIMVAHTLGNPFDVLAIRHICDRHGLFLIEDCCDALGATVGGRHVGTFGDIGTLSFYPAHHITMGEGGAVFTSDNKLAKIMESFRDWGRDCYCDPGADNSCNKRFGWSLGDLPHGYDHKYIYSHLGYNLKITDMQAAVGLAQLDHLEDFIAARRRNFAHLEAGLAHLQNYLRLPAATLNTEPSWFGFALTIRDEAPFTRHQLLIHLNANGIGTRLLFGGNLVRQPYMKGRDFRVAGSLANADVVVERTFWIGVYPGLDANAIAHMISVLSDFCLGQQKIAV